MPANPPEPPPTLSQTAAELWREIQDSYRIQDAAGLAVLRVACEAYTRMEEAQAVVADEGLVVTDRYNGRKMHPAVSIERSARAQFLAALAQLGLDLEPLHDRVGRPAGAPTVRRVS